MIGILETGSKAIDLTLPDEHGNPVAPHDFKGEKAALYFYLKDNTPGCTKQVCTFKVTYKGLKWEDIVVIGISKDSSVSHMRFKEKYELPFPLLSDTELSVIQAYDAWKEKKLHGKTYMGVTCLMYIIDEGGVVIKAFEKISPANNVVDTLQYVKDIRQTLLYALP